MTRVMLQKEGYKMAKITRIEFEEEVKRRAESRRNESLLALLENIEKYDTFERIRGYDLLQYHDETRKGETWGGLVKKYFEDHYPKCKYDCRFAGLSIALARVKTERKVRLSKEKGCIV